MVLVDFENQDCSGPRPRQGPQARASMYQSSESFLEIVRSIMYTPVFSDCEYYGPTLPQHLQKAKDLLFANLISYVYAAPEKSYLVGICVFRNCG